MELYQYTRILLKRWWLIAALLLVGGASALYYTTTQPPVYQSTVTLLLSPAPGQDALLPQYLSDRTNQLAQTYTRYLKTRTFAELVIKREGLNISPDELVNSINARVVEGTQFFEITASSSSPERAQQLASLIANNFIQENLAQQQEQLAARQSASEAGAMQALLREKLERERQYYDEQIADLRVQVDQLKDQPPSSARDQRLAAVQDQLSQYEERLLQIMNDQIALQPVNQDAPINTVTVIEPAPLPTRPVNTQRLQDILVALAASLVLGVTLAFGLEYLDYTIKSPEELEMIFGQAPLAVIGESGAASEETVIALERPQSPITEAFRALRTSIRFSRVGQQLRSIVVTSAGPGEGKSTVASNLATVLAQSGQRVLLVDADLRKPALHRRFHLVNNLGLSSLMLANDPMDTQVMARHIQQGPVDTLYILTSGPIPPNPAELLSTEFAHRILQRLEEQVDVVIYDTPPALTVTDAVILASRADATLQVIMAGQTRRDVALKCRSVLQSVHANVLAPVLNRVKAGDVGYYHYYYYYSKYGYREKRDQSGAHDGKDGRPRTRRRREADAEQV